MGKLKVSFTTALFVFSFLVCVIVAVVFVDSGGRGERDSFYEEDRAGETGERDDNESADGTGADAWAKRKQAAQPAPTATPTAHEALLADLPIDPHLAGAAQPIPAAAATPAGVQATANPHVGKSPEQIARELMGAGGVQFSAPQPTPVPGMAIPGGIATPAQQTIVTATPQAAMPQTNGYLPMQSNVSGDAVGGAGNSFPSPGGFSGSLGSSMAAPSLSGTTNMSGSGWDTVAGKQTPDTMVGVRAATGADEAGMMISGGKSTVSEPPLGFEPTITNDGNAPAPGFGARPSPTGDTQAPLLFPPGSTPATGNKWDLPPAPTLRPPPIQDPDQRRSDADSPESGSETPDSTNPDGSSGQALAVSSTDGTSTVESAEPGAIAARVNEVELTEEEAARLAQVTAKLAEEDLTPENRQEKITEAVRNWTTTVAAAEQARKEKITLSTTDVERYAAMRPDFDMEAWEKSMAEVGFTKAEIEKHLEAIALCEKLVEEKLEKKYPDEELKKVYEKTPKEFYAPRQVHVLEIFKAKPEDEKQAKRVASEMSRLQRQAAGGTDFNLLARTTSQAPSKAKGGDLGWITPEDKEKTKPEMAKAVADLKPGQISDVVETEDGYRIYKLVAEKEARDTFEGAKELVIEKLKDDVRKDALADAKDEAEVELAPKKEIKVAEAKPEQKKDDSSKKESSAKTSSEKAPTVNASPQRRIEQAAAAGQLLYAPGTPVEQRAGGSPAPPVQAGGQPPVQQRMAANANEADMRSYLPGQTMTVGGEEQPQGAVNPANQGQINYAAPLSVGAVATPDPNLTPEQQALQLRALQARTQQEDQAKNAEVESQMQAARAFAARQAQMQSQQQQVAGAGPGGAMDMSQNGNARAGAAAPELPGRPVTTHSNGWQVTKSEVEPQPMADARPNPRQGGQRQSADDGITIPPGFEGSPAGVQPQQATVQQPVQQAQPQQQAEAEQQREGGFFSGVRNLFNRGR